LGTFNPTQRPGEPLTHGLASGPGAGPEALPQTFAPDPIVQASALLSSIPAVHQTPAIKALAAAVNASMANGTNANIAQGGAQ
jgi:predicted aconitase with swiveling domain